MSSRARYISLSGLALAMVSISGLAQSTTPNLQTLHSIVQDLETHPEGYGPQWAADLDGPVNIASISEIKQELPILVRLTESPNPQQRGNALLVLYAIAAGRPENRRERDLLADDAIVPYISRLAPRSNDPSTSNRGLYAPSFSGFSCYPPSSARTAKGSAHGVAGPTEYPGDT